jgi:hypothetical protein
MASSLSSSLLGLANILWQAPSFTDCNSSPMVFEVVADTTTSKNGVQTGGSMKSYFNLMGGMPWVRYYHMFLSHNSTNEAIYINLDTLTKCLNQMFAMIPRNDHIHQQKELNSNIQVLMPSFKTSSTSNVVAAAAASPQADQSSHAAASSLIANMKALHSLTSPTFSLAGGASDTTVPFILTVFASHKTGSTFLRKVYM